MDVLHRILGLAVRTLSKTRSSPSQTRSASRTAPVPADPLLAEASSCASRDETVCTIRSICSTTAGDRAERRDGGAELAYWEWEAAVQSFTDLHIRRWLSLSRSFKPAGGLTASASAPSLSSADSCLSAEQQVEQQQRLSFSLLPSAGACEAVKGLLRWEPLQGLPALLWPMVTLLIFLAPVAACVAAAVAWPAVLRPALCTWLIAELLFLVFRAHELKRASQEVVPQAVPSQEEVSQLLDRILALRCIGVVQPHEFLSGWFLGAPPASLSRQRVKEFLAFGLYHRDLTELPGDVQMAVEEHLGRIEERWGIQFACKAQSLATASGGRQLGAGYAAAFEDIQSTGDRSCEEAAGALLAAARSEEGAQGVALDDAAAVPGSPRAMWGASPSKTESVSFMAHTREPLKVFLHPLALYAWGHLVGGMTALAMALMGFRRKTCKSTGLCYYLLRRSSRPPAAEEPAAEKTPLNEEHKIPLGLCPGEEEAGAEEGEACVLVHGLGIGITPYLAFIHEILTHSRHKAVAVLELPHLAFRLTSSVPTVDELVTGLDEVVEDCAGSAGRASFIGHSYGSLVLAQYVRTRPQRVASLGLVDPVCILLCLPHVIYNFIYKNPDLETLKGAVADSIRMLLCSRELNVARALCRGFNWHDLHLWAHHMPKRTVVMLAGEDRIVPSIRVKRYLEAHSVPVLYNEHFGHAQFLFRPDVQKSFLLSLYGKQPWSR